MWLMRGGVASAEYGDMGDLKLAFLLTCFRGVDGAGKARRPIDAELRAGGAVVLDSTVLKVSDKHKAVYDPRHVLMGALTPGLTWGLFGLLASGWVGLAIWAVLGAICGGLYAYYAVHHASRAQLTHIGARLPSSSSALLTAAETGDPIQLLRATAGQKPTVASVASIASDLSVRVFAGAEDPAEVAHGSTEALPADKQLLSMIMLRYPDPAIAKQIAKRIRDTKATDAPEIELVIETDADHRRSVTDPTLGPAALARSSLISWGAFGVVAGAISGAGGGGILEGGVVTGLVWGAFGMFAGALYGLWAGRSATARRLKGIGPLLAPDTSMLLAWADGPVSPHTINALTAAESHWLVLGFTRAEGGAVLA